MDSKRFTPAAAEHESTDLHQIGEVSDRMELSLRTVRYYEEAGLVKPSGRTPGGFRLYGQDALERFTLIKHMKPLGFSIEEMRLLLATLEEREREELSEDEAEHLEGRLEMFAVAAREKYTELSEQVRVARSFVEHLERSLLETPKEPPRRDQSEPS